MKVLHVIDHAGLGGAQRVLEAILRAGDTDEHLVYVVNTSKKPYSFFDGKFQTSYWGKFFPPLHIFQLMKIVHSEKITHLHAHLEVSQILSFITHVFFPHTKLIFHEHGKIVRSTFLYRKIIQLAYFSGGSFIAISHHTEGALKKIIPSKAVHYLPNPVLKPTQDREVSSIYTIGFIGRLIALKGWRVFVDTARELPDYRFIIAGDGQDRIQIEEYLKETSIKNVELWGFVDPASKIFDEIDVFAFLSNNEEGMGLTHLEAVSVGIPVITTRTKATEEIFVDKENCLMIAIDDTDAFISAIQTLSRNSRLRSTIISGGKTLYSQFDVNEYYRNLRSVYINSFNEFTGI